MASLKILACGSVDGNFSKVFKRISSIQKKNGPFEMVLCAGNFFTPSPECKENWKSFLKKTAPVDVPVYLLGPTSKELQDFYSKDALSDGEELLENVLYLGKKGIFKTTSGLVIAYLSGLDQTNQSSSCFSKSDINALKEQVRRDDKFQGVDILLTSAWPKDITKYTKTNITTDNESSLISSLATTLRPRYHICCHNNSFFERTPYRNHQVLQQEQQHVSRFISLAPFANTQNQKAIYAFSITPMSKISREELIKQPEDVTEFPYNDVSVRTDDNQQEQQQFFFNKDESHKRKEDKTGGDHRQHKVPRGPPALKGDCWFCLGSKGVEKHLVVSVGEHCYVALAKGALNVDHVLICPVSHHNSTVVLPDDVRLEMEKYKDCLRKMFLQENKVMVTYERNFYTQHLQLQVVGLPMNVSEDIRDAFQDFAEVSSLELIDIPEDKDLSELVSITTPYFLVEISPGERILHKVKGKMPLQFGREVLASPSLLNLPDRVDWKECKLTKDTEAELAKKFRKRFQSFDFNFT